MATERLPMRKIREILRLRWALGLSVRRTARSLGVSTGVVSTMSSRAKAAGLDWERLEAMGDEELERLLYGERVRHRKRPEPDPVWIDTELRRPGVTLELLHIEYLAEYPDGLQYTAFCERYRKWRKRRCVTLRQVHKAGDKSFVDYSGKKPAIIDRETGKAKPVELFVAVLGASSLTYAEASESQRIGDWLRSNTRALEYFEGVPGAVVPDQLRSAVSVPCRFEPVIQRSFAQWAEHYGTAVVPARPGKAKDKAKVEAGVLVAQRWILARLRHETFFSLAELNARIAELLEDLNNRPRRNLGGVTRRELYERLERAVLRPLPERRYEIAEWREAKVHLDYHIDVDSHWYSVPHSLVGERVEVRLTTEVVEVFYLGRRVASHRRSSDRFKPSTKREHMPANHRAWVDKDPGGLLSWAAQVGPHTEAFMKRLLDRGNNIHPDSRWRSGRGLRRLAEEYGNERVEEASRRALRFGGRSYKHVQRMLKLGLDQQPLGDEVPEDDAPIDHEQVRGAGYYH